jgi:hypothetical protein
MSQIDLKNFLSKLPFYIPIKIQMNLINDKKLTGKIKIYGKFGYEVHLKYTEQQSLISFQPLNFLLGWVQLGRKSALK